MATLVLTAVGGVVGGPVGAALGGLLGQAVDARVLRPKGRQGPRLTELAVQTSSYGTAIPKVFGTMRVAGCVIWSTDLIETKGTSRGGKGQASTTNYSYSVSFAVALSGRRIQGVGRIWAEGKLLRGAGGDFKSETGFRLHLGDEAQAADPLIAAAEGAALAPAHRGIAYAVFEDFQLADYGNRIPSLTFEVIGDAAPVTVGVIVAELNEGRIVAGADLIPLDGFSAYGDSVRAVAETLGVAAGGWFAPAGEAVALRCAGDPVATIADAGVGGAARRTIAPVETVARTLTLAHYDPARDYQAGVQGARRPGARSRAEQVEVAAAIGAGAAKTMAGAMLMRREIERVRRVVTGDIALANVAPGNIVAIAGERGAWRVVKAEVEAMVTTLELVALAPVALPAVADAGRVSAAPDAAIGTTVLVAVETPALDDSLPAQPRLTIVAAGKEPGWRRAALQSSIDGGTTWVPLGQTAPAGIVGRTASVLRAAATTLVDRVTRLEVVLSHDGETLLSADAAAIDAGANLAVIAGELLQFERAERIAPAHWRLSGLWRGRRGTVAAEQAPGAAFALLQADTALVVPVDGAPGGTVRIMASGVGDAVPVVADARLSGASVLPPAPVRLAWRRLGGESIELSWRRRSRTGWRWIDGSDVPLGEEREAYRVDIVAAAGTTSMVVAEPGVVIDPTRSGTGPYRTEVRQLGNNGASPAATLIIEGDG